MYNILIQGDTVRLLCDSASPDLSWTVGGRVVTEAAGSRLLELAASRRLQGAAVTCAATTEAGTNTATLKLDIKCEFIYQLALQKGPSESLQSRRRPLLGPSPG